MWSLHLADVYVTCWLPIVVFHLTDVYLTLFGPPAGLLTGFLGGVRWAAMGAPGGFLDFKEASWGGFGWFGEFCFGGVLQAPFIFVAGVEFAHSIVKP